MRKYRTLVIIVSLAAILMAVGAGFYMYNMPHKNIEKSKAEYVLSCIDLQQKYIEDEAEADAIFLGQIVEVYGEVNSIEMTSKGDVSITFIDSFEGISCTIDSSDVIRYSEMINAIEIGDMLTVKGRVDGKLTDVRLSKCHLVTAN